MSTHGNKVSSHTPGPWEFDHDLSRAHVDYESGSRCIIAPKEGGSPVICTTSHGWDDGGQTCEANVRLIAAAPKMLALLQELWREPRVVSHSQGPSEDWLLRARAVMREATGDF